MANEVTNTMGIELPTPGVTGALGVEAPGASWMELQNEGFRKVDFHDHGVNGGAPLNQDAIVIDADFPFNGFSAIDLKSTRYLDQTALLGGVDDKTCIYFKDGDFYINNSAGTAVRITNGASIMGAAGNITGMTGGAAVTYNAGLGVFIFESSSGVKAGIYAGPISIFDPVAGGKKVTLSVISGLAADYDLVLPTALPATKKALFLANTGQITAEDISLPSTSVDGTSIISTDGTLSVKDLGISTGKIADLAVTAAKLANGVISKDKLAALTVVRSTSSGANVGQASGDVSGLSINIVTGGRPVRLALESDGAGGTVVFQNPTGALTEIYLTLQRSPHAAGTWTTVAQLGLVSNTGVTGFSNAPGAFAHTDSAAAGDWDYKISVTSTDPNLGVAPQYVKLVAYEL